MYFLILYFLIVLQAFALTLSAQTKEEEKESELEEMVIIETRTPVPESHKSPWVTRIRAEEWETRQVDSISDLLRTVPGMSVTRSGQVGAQSSLFSRGSNSDHTTFLYQGRKLNGGFSGTYNLGQIPLVGFSSLEILRGSSSVQYGAEGIGGAVNFNVSQKKDSYSKFGFEIGSFNSISSNINAGLANGMVSLSYLETDNDRPNANYKNLSGSFLYDIELSDEWKLDLVGMGYEAQMGVPGALSFSSLTDFQDNENFLISPRLTTQGDDWNWESFYSRTHEKVVTNWGTQILNADQLETQWTIKPQDFLTVALGANFQGDHFDDIGNGVNERVENFAQFGLFSVSFSEITTFTFGLRHENYSTYGSKWTNTIFARHEISENNELFMRYSSNFAPPTSLDMHGWSGANPNLLPEESMSYEIGAHLNFDFVNLELVLFQNDFENMIEFFDPDNDWVGVMKNLSQAKTQGIEITGEIPMSNTLSGTIGYTYLDAKAGNGQRLARRPRQSLSFGLLYQIGNRSIGVEMLELKDRMDSATQNADDYIVCRLYGMKELSENFQVNFRLENLLDEDYQEVNGYPALGFGAYGGLKYNF